MSSPQTKTPHRDLRQRRCPAPLRRAAATRSNVVPPAGSSSKRHAPSASAPWRPPRGSRYLNAPSSPARSRSNAIRMNDATDVISMKTYSEKRSAHQHRAVHPDQRQEQTLTKLASACVRRRRCSAPRAAPPPATMPMDSSITRLRLRPAEVEAKNARQEASAQHARRHEDDRGHLRDGTAPGPAATPAAARTVAEGQVQDQTSTASGATE